MSDTSPIIVSGPPRSGTTWMQWFLSQHPQIHIHGQEPQLSWSIMLSWYDRLIEAGKWGKKSNHSNDVKDYSIPHYAGSDPERCKRIFARMAKDFLCGYGDESKPRWGIKCLWLCTNQENVNKIKSIWPDTKWIVCIRDPFLSFESQKNTFVKDQELDSWIKRWIGSARFIEKNEGFLFQIDKLSEDAPEIRKQAVNNLLENYIGEKPSIETETFIDSWKRVHRVKSDKERTYHLSDKRKDEMFNKFTDLKEYMTKLGY